MILKMRNFGKDKGRTKSKRLELDTCPAPTIQKGGMGGVGIGQFEVNFTASKAKRDNNKPLFAIPSMREIGNAPRNGLKVISTFAGCGGSSVGWRMAGYEVVWANEFDSHAAHCYELNSKLKVDRRDVHLVMPEEVLTATGLKVDELDVLDGSPPCQTFSTAGKRRMDDPRSTLFFEYARLLRELQPRCFIAENGSGMVKGVAKGYFKLILAELRACGYEVECRLLDAQWLGVPQQRQRVIFMGVRSDLAKRFDVHPMFPNPLPYRYSVRDALPWIGQATYENGEFKTDAINLNHDPMPSICKGGVSGVAYVPIVKPDPAARSSSSSRPSPTVLKSDSGFSDIAIDGHRKFTIAEVKRICAFPDDFMLDGSYASQWARLGNAVPPVMMFHIAKTLKEQVFDRMRNA